MENQRSLQIIPQEIPTITQKNHETGLNRARIPESRLTEQNRTEHTPVKKDVLPLDIEFKGYRHVIKQNIKFETDNVEYILERFYSSSENKVYEAELPDDVQDSEFGSDLKSFIVYLYYAGRVTETKIQKILEESGIIISIVEEVVKGAGAENYLCEADCENGRVNKPRHTGHHYISCSIIKLSRH